MEVCTANAIEQRTWNKFSLSCSVWSSFFSERVVTLWNSLPGDRISFTSLCAFKNSLKTVDLQSLTLYVTIGRLTVVLLIFLVFFCVFTRTWLRYVRVFAVAIPSVVCLSVVYSLSSVCNVGAPYSGGWSFRQNFFTAVYACHPLTSMQNFTEIVLGKPLRRER